MFYPNITIGFIGILYRYQADRFMLLSIVQYVSSGIIVIQDCATVGERMKSRQTSEKQALTPYSSTDKTLKYCEYVGCIFKSITLHEFLQSLSVTRIG